MNLSAKTCVDTFAPGEKAGMRAVNLSHFIGLEIVQLANWKWY